MQILFLIIEGFVSEYKGSERQITKTNLSLPADCDIDDSCHIKRQFVSDIFCTYVKTTGFEFGY